MADEVTITGLAELEKRLQALPEQIKRGGLIMRALRSAARLIRDQARQNAPVLNEAAVTKSGALRKKFKAAYAGAKRKPGALRSGINDAFSREQELTAIVRVRNKGYIFASGGNRAAATSPNYWWLLEFGTSRVRPLAFMRRAFESKKMEAAEQIKRGLADEINKANANPEAYAASQQRSRR